MEGRFIDQLSKYDDLLEQFQNLQSQFETVCEDRDNLKTKFQR